MVLLPPRLFGSIAYYRAAAHYGGLSVVDYGMRYDKRCKAVHRFEIADTRGRLALTVPVSRPAGAFLQGDLRWCDVTVSNHGRWWEVMTMALESAYGRTPFFEFYIDRLRPLFTEPSASNPEKITDLCRRADTLVRPLLDLPPAAELTEQGPDAVDLRRAAFDEPGPVYWQLRSAALGFIPNLSVLDLIFSVGPEAPLFIHPPRR